MMRMLDIISYLQISNCLTASYFKLNMKLVAAEVNVMMHS